MPKDVGSAPAGEPADARGHQPRQRRRPRERPWAVIAVVALGGALGAAARYGLGVSGPIDAGSFPWATFTVNTVGCALMGVLIVLAAELWPANRLIRPFVGTGILGGFTTFSAYAVELEHLITVGAARTALLYLVATPVAAVAAVWLTAVLTRGALRMRVGEANR